MKTKRSGYLQKGNQGKKQSTASNSDRATSAERDNDKQNDAQCNGVCSIAWKPALASR